MHFVDLVAANLVSYMAMVARGVFACDMRSSRLGKAVFSNAVLQRIMCLLWLLILVFLRIDGVTFE